MPEKLGLWVDDQRPKPPEFAHYAKSVGGAIWVLKQRPIDFVSLDYDLIWDDDLDADDWPNTKTGMAIVLWMEKNGFPPDGVWIHSGNAEGALLMQLRLKEHYKGRYER